MTYSILDIENHLKGMIHDSTLNKVVNKYYVHERAANAVKSKIDLITSMRTAPLTNTVHSNVYNYALPSDFSKLIDIYPQANRQNADFAFQQAADTFDLLKNVNDKQLAIESHNGVRFLRLDWDVITPKTLDSINSVTNWTAIGDAANLAADTLNYISPSKSLSFDVVTTGDGVQNVALSSKDLSNEDEQSTFFIWLYIPNTDNITSLQAKWGNDLSTAYWTSAAVTKQYDGTDFKVGWNQIAFEWEDATEVGTVDPSAIDSFAIEITGNAQAGYKLDSITVSRGAIFEIKYYSAYFFQSNTGTYKIRPTDDTDVVVLDDNALNIYLMEWLIAAAQQLEGSDSAFDVQFAYTALNGNASSPDPFERKGLIRKYNSLHPSQVKKRTSSWMSSRSSFRKRL